MTYQELIQATCINFHEMIGDYLAFLENASSEPVRQRCHTDVALLLGAFQQYVRATQPPLLTHLPPPSSRRKRHLHLVRNAG